jgi:hypothetical protein
MKVLYFTATLVLLTSSAGTAALLIPTKQGTTWQYDATDETGGANTQAESQIRFRIAGTQQFGGKELLKLEALAGDVSTRTELVAVDENGIRSFAHTGKDGKMIGFIAPQIIVPAKLKTGTSWECVDEIADVRVHQHFTVTATEKISVPAGEFRAFRLHCEETTPISVTVDRWFVTGVGFVKEVATLRSPTGDLLNRRTLQLAKLPAGETKTEPIVKKLSVGISRQPIGNFETEFANTTQDLYARWQGHDLRQNSKVRAVWIAEDVGEIAPPNYKIDDAVATVSAPDARGMFTLSRPEDGWAPGSYRVEFYLDETLIETVKLKIR